MQALRYSFFLFLLIILLTIPYLVQSQPGKEKLQKADSLYQKQRYIEAFEIYQDLVQKQKVYSPALLLKMAFIKESLNEYTDALYYLSLYYSKHPSRNTLKKMESLAQQHDLQGFEYSDYDFFATQARKYYMRILELLMMAAVVVVTASLVAKLRGRKIRKETSFIYLVFLIFLFYYLNFLSFGRYGIVNSEQLAMMSGPSAGSNLIKTLPKGNRLGLLEEEDIWLKVKLEDSIGYVRKDHILLPSE